MDTVVVRVCAALFKKDDVVVYDDRSANSKRKLSS